MAIPSLAGTPGTERHAGDLGRQQRDYFAGRPETHSKSRTTLDRVGVSMPQPDEARHR